MSSSAVQVERLGWDSSKLAWLSLYLAAGRAGLWREKMGEGTPVQGGLRMMQENTGRGKKKGEILKPICCREQKQIVKTVSMLHLEGN